MYLTFLSIQEGHSKKFRGNLKKCGDYVKQFKTQNSMIAKITHLRSQIIIPGIDI